MKTVGVLGYGAWVTIVKDKEGFNVVLTIPFKTIDLARQCYGKLLRAKEVMPPK